MPAFRELTQVSQSPLILRPVVFSPILQPSNQRGKFELTPATLKLASGQTWYIPANSEFYENL